MNNIFIGILVIGSITGFGAFIFGLIYACVEGYKYFKWFEFKLSENEIALLEKAIIEEQPIYQVLCKLTSSKGFVFKDWSYNKATKKLKIRG